MAVSFDLRRTRQTIFGQSTEFLIGELLVKAGVIKQSQLDEALKLAGNKHMQIGQMLIMARYVTPKELQAGIDAQVSIRDKSIDVNLAVRALSTACRQHITFAEASQKHSQDTLVIPKNNPLGELLHEANLVTAEQLSLAVQKSMALGLPVGRILILNNVITEAILSAAIEVQIRLRDGKISREEANAYLSDINRTKEISELGLAGLEDSLFSLESSDELSGKKGLRLGEFLILAGILSETDVMNALEFSLCSDQQLGQTLLEHGYVTQELIDGAIKLQSLVESGSFDSRKAAQCLNNIHLHAISLAEAIEAVSSEIADGTRVDFRTLLAESNLVTNEQIQSALELAVSNPSVLANILTQTGYLTNIQSEIVLACHDSMVQNIVSQQDAKFVLDFCLQKLKEGPITYAQGLHELGWSKEGTDARAPGIVREERPGNSVLSPTLPMPQPASSFPSLQGLSSPPPANRSGRQVGRTTTNIRTLPNIQAGSDLLRPGMSPDDLSITSSSELQIISSQNTPVPPAQGEPPKAKAGAGRSTDRSLSLKALLKEEDDFSASTLEISSSKKAEEANMAQIADPIVAEADVVASVKNIDEQNREESSLELSDSEKALIMKASSLTASPQEIMDAMKLAAKKEKTIQPQDKKEEEDEEEEAEAT